MNFGCEEGKLEFRHSSIRCSELYSSKLLNEAIINAIQKAISYEGETKILADNPASMFQVAQTMLDTVQTPIFIILERAHELFASLYDAITVLLRHTKYLSGNKLCLVLESRDHLHRLNYPSICPRPVILHLPEYTRAQVRFQIETFDPNKGPRIISMTHKYEPNNFTESETIKVARNFNEGKTRKCYRNFVP